MVLLLLLRLLVVLLLAVLPALVLQPHPHWELLHQPSTLPLLPLPVLQQQQQLQLGCGPGVRPACPAALEHVCCTGA